MQMASSSTASIFPRRANGMHVVRRANANDAGWPRVLLIGPYDPHCGEYTFLAPPLGVWRLAGVLQSAGVETKVFDPNCCREPPQRALERELFGAAWDIVGVS